MKLFTPYTLGKTELKNRIVMAPLTRSRAIDNIPNEMMAEYYRQRSGAGLIITEGTSPSPNGLGYPRIPGIFNQEQIEGWKKITSAVHEDGGKIFIQLMHTGRVSHPLNLPEGSRLLAPSATKVSGEMYTDEKGMQEYPEANEMRIDEINEAQAEYVQAAKNAIEAGFDGVELHGANGYLIEQFLNPASNKRADDYGGSLENRNRFAVEVAQKVSDAIGADKVGIRLSPYGVFNDIKIYEGIDQAFESLAVALGKIGLVYIHLVDHSSMGTPHVPVEIKEKIAKAFGNTIIISGGLNKESGEKVLEKGLGELVAFGRPFISNPDLVLRYKNNLELAEADSSTFYTPGKEGYTDYPSYKVAESTST